MKKIIGAVLILSAGLFSLSSGFAANRVLRVHTFDLEDVEGVEINNSVGSIEIYPVRGNEMRVEVDIEGEDRFFRPDVDVDDVDVEVRNRRGNLILTIDDDDVKADWYIEMPVVDSIEIDMGVGEIDVEVERSTLDINLGVGDIEIEAPLATVGEIDITSGVGDTDIRGTDTVVNSRAVVTSESEAFGDGEFPIDADVGVGEITVDLN